MNDRLRDSAYVYDRDVFRPGMLFYRPGAAAWFGRLQGGSLEFCHQLRWNNWGFRDDVPYAPRSSAREFRIAVIGDSFTSNLDSEIAWPNLLDALLKERVGPQTQVFNLGLPGAGPANWMALRGVVRLLAPDVVVLGCYDGILSRPAIGFFADQRRQRFYCRYGYPIHTTRPIGICDGAFRARPDDERAAQVRALDREQQAVHASVGAHLRTWVDRRWAGGRTIMQLNAERIRRIAGWAPAALVVRCPSQARFTGEAPEDASAPALERAATDAGAVVVDLCVELQGTAAERVYTADSRHWNVEGNRRVAERMAQCLEPILRSVRRGTRRPSGNAPDMQLPTYSHA